MLSIYYHQKNTQFHNTSEGFNVLCKHTTSIDNDKPDTQFVNRVQLLLENHWADDQFHAGKLIDLLHMSHSIALRYFRQSFGTSATVLLKDFRLSKARKMLQSSLYNISETAYSCGFSDPKYFSRCFRNTYGLTPKAYRESITCAHNTQNTHDTVFVSKALQLLENKLNQYDLNFDSFAEELNVSKTTLYRRLKSVTGLSPCEFIRSNRLRKSAELLRHSEHNIEDVASNVGFTDPKHFSRCFKNQYGISPYSFRKSAILPAV